MNENQLEALKIRHKDLDEQIKKGYSKYLADANLNKMKIEKLQLKDKIEKLSKKL